MVERQEFYANVIGHIFNGVSEFESGARPMVLIKSEI
jgi:hypothetical protein